MFAGTRTVHQGSRQNTAHSKGAGLGEKAETQVSDSVHREAEQLQRSAKLLILAATLTKTGQGQTSVHRAWRLVYYKDRSVATGGQEAEARTQEPQSFS